MGNIKAGGFKEPWQHVDHACIEEWKQKLSLTLLHTNNGMYHFAQLYNFSLETIGSPHIKLIYHLLTLSLMYVVLCP